LDNLTASLESTCFGFPGALPPVPPAAANLAGIIGNLMLSTPDLSLSGPPAVLGPGNLMPRKPCRA